VQDEGFDVTNSITMCVLTPDWTEAPRFRSPVEANDRKHLRATCRLMVDKVTTVRTYEIGAPVDCLDDERIMRRKTPRVERFCQLFEAAGGME